MCLFAAASKCDPQLALKHMGLCGTQREKEKSDLASLEVYLLSSILAEIKQVHRDAEMAEEQAARRSELVNSKPIFVAQCSAETMLFLHNAASRAMKGLYLLVGGVAIAFLSVGTLQVRVVPGRMGDDAMLLLFSKRNRRSPTLPDLQEDVH